MVTAQLMLTPACMSVLQVALNSIAFLRFCASRLAEGAIGELAVALPEGVDADKMGPTRVVSAVGVVLYCL